MDQTKLKFKVRKEIRQLGGTPGYKSTLVQLCVQLRRMRAFANLTLKAGHSWADRYSHEERSFINKAGLRND